MRLLCVLTFVCLTLIGRAAEWRNELFGCSANLPDSPGWQPIPAENSPGLTVLVAMQQPQKQAVFGINVLHNLPTSNLRDDATVQSIEKLLRGFGYQFIGRSTVSIAGREWVQFPVRASNNGQPLTGIIRYTSANNQIYGVSLLRGGGQEAAQDPELQAAGMSVRIANVEPPAPSATSTPGGTPAPGSSSIATTPGAPAPATTDKETTTTKADDGSVKIGPITLTQPQLRMAMYGGAGLIVLLILLKLIGGAGGPPKRR
jgi:hypothetical protein